MAPSRSSRSGSEQRARPRQILVRVSAADVAAIDRLRGVDETDQDVMRRALHALDAGLVAAHVERVRELREAIVGVQEAAEGLDERLDAVAEALGTPPAESATRG